MSKYIYTRDCFNLSKMFWVPLQLVTATCKIKLLGGDSIMF